MGKKLIAKIVLQIFISVVLVVVHYVLKVEDVKHTIMLGVLIALVTHFVSNLNNNPRCREKVIDIILNICFVFQAAWLIAIVVKALHLPLLYEDLICYPVIGLAIVIAIVKCKDIRKVKREAEFGGD